MGKFAPLIGLMYEDMGTDTMVTTYSTAVTDAASEILGKERHRKKLLVKRDQDERRDLKIRRSKRIQGSKQEDSEGNEESKGGLNRFSTRGD